MIQVCHKNIKSYVLNNGHISESLPITRGFRQGCPLSCLCFDLVIELIAIRIRHNKKIEGVTVGTKTKKVGQYADDLWVSLKYKKQCFTELFAELRKFGDFTGLKVNYNKTEVLRIGSLKNTDAKFYSELPLHWSDGPIRILGILTTANLSKTSEVNYLDLLKKIQNICKIWSKRSLTLLGRILIVNTLIIPTLIYRLSVLRTPDKKFQIEYKKTIREFLWQGKRSQIAYNRLIRSYEGGGLKLFDLNYKNIAMKCKWIQTLNFQQSLILELIVKELPLTLHQIKEANFSPKDIHKRLKDGLIKDILVAWATFNYYSVSSANQVKSQVHWFNSHIREDNDIIFLPQWYRKGILTLGQIIQDSKLMTLDQIQRKFGKSINFIEYARVYKAIPKEWFSIIKHKISTEIDVAGTKILKDTIKCSKIIYEKLRDRDHVVSKGKLFWETELNMEFLSQDWQKLYLDVMKLTSSTKLRFFQFRIINKYLPTNVLVSKWDRTVSSLCSFCSQADETLLHLFVECSHVIKIWSMLKKWLYHFCFVEIAIDPVQILLNKYKEAFTDMVNTIILITKYYIYTQRSFKHQLSFRDVISYISKYKRIEFMAAKKTGKISHHLKKWHMYDCT